MGRGVHKPGGRNSDGRAGYNAAGYVSRGRAMPTPEMSDEVTEGIRVGASAFYLAQESDPDEDRYAFGYTIVIANEGDEPAQLLRRHWMIIDANGHREDV